MAFSELRPCWKWITSTAAVVSAVAVIAGGVTWAADTRYVTIVAQAQTEMRQLKRDIKRLELKAESGNASAEDKAFVEYLKQDLEELQTEE
jgi:hypothetical protein